MSSLGKEQVAELTALVNERLDEWDFPHTLCYARKMPPGLLRLVFDVIEQWQDEQLGTEEVEWIQPVGNGFELVKNDDGRVTEQTPWSESFAELAQQWPTMEALPDGNDLFAEHGIAGEPVDDEPVYTDGHHTPEPAALSPSTTATLGPEHTIVTPLVPRTLDEVHAADVDDHDDDDAASMTPARRRRLDDLKHKRRLAKDAQESAVRKGNVTPTLDDLIAEVQRQAMAGVMPSQSVFNAAKPANWATATAHLTRLNLSWEQLAEAAALKPGRMGRPVGAR